MTSSDSLTQLCRWRYLFGTFLLYSFLVIVTESSLEWAVESAVLCPVSPA